MKKQDEAARPVKTLTLSTGQVATVRPGKGRDIRIAARSVNAAQDPMGYAMALMACLTMIDGKPIVLEDLDEMELEDVNALMELLPGKSLTPGMRSV